MIKRALLVGINAYPGAELYGCLNDVKQVRELLTGTFGFDEHDIKVLEDKKATLKGIEAGLAVAKPGNTCEQIEAALRGVLSKFGLDKPSRCGYPIGLSYPPDWGERTMSLRPGDTSVLEPDMTFHFMPGLWMDDWGIEITESFRITETGCECLADVPRKLFVKE